MAFPSSSSVIVNSQQPNSSTTSLESRKKKRKKLDTRKILTQSVTRWKTESQQQIYSSKLLEALRRKTLPSPPTVVRDAADRALAAAAKGRTRWSRALLNRRIKLLKYKKVKKPRAVTDTCQLKKPEVISLSGKKPGLERRARVLGRLVPGCRRVSFPVVLEEATDYIAALEMQVRAMASLVDLLTGSGGDVVNSGRPDEAPLGEQSGGAF